MEASHHVAHHTGALHIVAIGAETLIKHRPQNSPMNRLEAIARVGKRPADDDRHGVVEEGAFHLLLDLDLRVDFFVVGSGIEICWWLITHVSGRPIRSRGFGLRGHW